MEPGERWGQGGLRQRRDDSEIMTLKTLIDIRRGGENENSFTSRTQHVRSGTNYKMFIHETMTSVHDPGTVCVCDQTYQDA